jgi:hypothetical protein
MMISEGDGVLLKHHGGLCEHIEPSTIGGARSMTGRWNAATLYGRLE